jgi:hypothetical protein
VVRGQRVIHDVPPPHTPLTATGPFVGTRAC